jgi:hypothetical protein
MRALIAGVALLALVCGCTSPASSAPSSSPAVFDRSDPACPPLSRAVFGLPLTGSVDTDESVDGAEKFAVSCTYTGSWIPGLHTDLTIYRASPAQAAADYARDRSLSQDEDGWDTTDISGVGDAAFVATNPDSMGLIARARRGNAYVVAKLLLNADDVRSWKRQDVADLLNSLLAPLR